MRENGQLGLIAACAAGGNKRNFNLHITHDTIIAFIPLGQGVAMILERHPDAHPN